jgi:hypothetical protein
MLKQTVCVQSQSTLYLCFLNVHIDPTLPGARGAFLSYMAVCVCSMSNYGPCANTVTLAHQSEGVVHCRKMICVLCLVYSVGESNNARFAA